MFPLFELHEVERRTPPPASPLRTHSKVILGRAGVSIHTSASPRSAAGPSLHVVGLMGRRQAAGPPLGHRGQTDLFNDTNKNQ